ncbi:hypothetical protein DDF62_06935 [Caulobacter radicis]|nr:hypothetical protein DDF62_06935 [Caulobacter radicis]
MAQQEEQRGDWRAAETYRPLLSADASSWAWEFARRGVAAGSDEAAAPPDLCFAGAAVGAAEGPLAIWRFEADPSIPAFEARPADAADSDALDVRALGLTALVVTSDLGDQHVLIADGARRLRLAVTHGDVLAGPVLLSFKLPSRGFGAACLPAVRDLLVLRDTGRLPRPPRNESQRERRWLRALQALDARRAGASQRQIATLLFGDSRVAQDWSGASDYMRMRVQRLVRSAEQMAAGRYRAVFGLRPLGSRPGRPVAIWLSA